MPHHIEFEAIENFRDLGGYDSSYGMTEHGVFYRSATLAFATENDRNKMAEIGIKTILDLRDEKSKKEFPSPFKEDKRFRVIELPVNGHGRICHEYDDYVYSYIEMLENPTMARPIFKAIVNAEKPMVIHCNAGKDRTGVFSMALLMAAGVSFDDINADYMLSFPYLRKMTIETKSNHPEVPPLLLTPDIFFLKDVFARFEKEFGTIEEYFEGIGLNDDDIFYLSNMLGKQEKSCGAVVVRDNKILVEHMTKGHFSLPKGHVESFDKDEIDTAKREIREETGLEVEIVPGFRTFKNYSPSKGVAKKVVWFVAEAKEGPFRLQKEKVTDAYWLSAEDALITLSHDSDREILKEAISFWNKR